MNDIITKYDTLPKSFMDFSTLEKAKSFAAIIAKSSLCPKSYQGKLEDVLVAIEYGMNLGLRPLASLNNITVINGRPSVWGDAMLAIVKNGHDFEFCTETFDEEKKTAICEVKRKGEPLQIRSFGYDDAKQAALLGKPGPWSLMPKRMCQMRARSFALRDVFPHHIAGIYTIEEARDIIEIPTSDVKVEVAKAEKLEGIDLDTYTRIIDLIDEQNISNETVKKWTNKAGVEDLSLLTQSQGNKIIDFLSNKKGE